jgi:hypothetical protein
MPTLGRRPAGQHTHWLRHTALARVDRRFGYAVARAYAGHSDRAGETGTTMTSAALKASLHLKIAALLLGDDEDQADEVVSETISEDNENGRPDDL